MKTYRMTLKRMMMTVLMMLITVSAMRAEQKIWLHISGNGKAQVSLGETELTFDKDNMTTVKEDAPGKTVTISVEPEKGYTVSSVTAQLTTDAGNADTRGADDAGFLDVKKASDTEYTFEMPKDFNIRIYVTFESTSKGGDSEPVDPGFSGVYYIANDNSGGANSGSTETTAYSNANDNIKWYLVPADNPQQTPKNIDAYYSPNHNSANGSSETPFLTTYQTNKDKATVPSGVTERDNNSVWIVKKTSEGYYHVIHAATGKYVIYEVPLPNDPNFNNKTNEVENGKRKTMHLQTPDDNDYNLSTNVNYQFTITRTGSNNNFIYFLQPKRRSGWYWNPANGNRDKYYGQTSDKTITTNTVFQAGLVGVYNKDTDGGSKWRFEDASNDYTIWPEISTTDGLNFTIDPFVANVPSGYKIYYRLGGEEPALTDGGEPTDANTIEYPGTTVSFAGNMTVKAIAFANGHKSKVVSFTNNKCLKPTIINNKTATNTFTITSATDGATIYYTTDNTTPSNASTTLVNGGSFDLTDDMTVINAIAVKEGLSDSEIESYSIPKCATPTIEFDENDKIKITSGQDTDGNDVVTSIRYTVNNTTPTRSSGSEYDNENRPILGISQTVIKAVAYASGYLVSDVKTLTLEKCPTPVISYDGTDVTISCSMEGAYIYYITGSGNLTESSDHQVGPVTLPEIAIGTVIKAAAWKPGNAFSNQVQYTTTELVNQCAKPTFSYSNNKLTIKSATDGATIHYTTNGDDPTEGSATYSAPLENLAEGTTVKAIATKQGMTNSSVAIYEVFKEISSWTDIKADGTGSYVLSSSFNVNSTYSGTFKGIIDGQYIVITGNSFPLFDKLDGATIKNVILDNVNISTSANTNGHSGAIANEATGNTRIYNCGVLAKSGSSSVSGSGSGSVGGIVGEISGNTRVVNCFSYASISGGSTRAGIVGNNAGTVGNTRVAMCMMYGDMPSGTSPVYAGNHTSNSKNFSEYNYWLYSTTNSEGKKVKKNITYSVYNDQLAIDKEEYLTRFPFYRHILNTHRELASYFLYGDYAHVEEIGHWFEEKGANAAKYPIIEKWESNTKKTPVKPTTGNLPDYINDRLITSAVGSDAQVGEDGYLKVNVTINGSNVGSVDLPITGMDEEHYDYTWGKVVLPFANEFSGWTRVWSKVCTGWEITSVNGGTAGSYSHYDNADRNCTAKDLYSNSDYIYAQGGYYIVPYGVTSININAHFANAFYLSDPQYERAYNPTVNEPTNLGGTVPATYHGYPVYTSLSTLVSNLSATKNPHDQAIVLVGNYHYVVKNAGQVGFAEDKAVTIMSADDDNNQEPDYGWYSSNNHGRLEVPPLRFDFLPNIEIGMASRVTGSTYYPGIGLWHTRGWFELTETCVSNMVQCEINSSDFSIGDNSKGNNRWIANSGCFDQITRAKDDACTKLSYIQIGGNAYVNQLFPGSHTDNGRANKAVPIIVTGGQVNECYMTGNTAKGANNKKQGTLTGDMIYFWCAGGKIKKFLGAYMEEPVSAGLTAKIDHAIFGRFFGGGTSAAARIKGNIDITINNSTVDFYCGGPEFGDMYDGKTVTTHATGTTFGEYYGAGFGGTSITYNREAQDFNVSISAGSVTYPLGFTNYTDHMGYTAGFGFGSCYSFDYLFHSNGMQAVARFYTGYAQFSLATTGSVTNILNNCIIKKLPGTNSQTVNETSGDFYGAGCQGMVNGTVNSTLTDCTLEGSAFGGGYKAESNEVIVYPTTQPTYAVYTKETGIFGEFGTVTLSTSDKYTWEQGNATTQNSKSGTTLYTSKDINMANLGNVTGAISLTIDGGYVGGTSEGQSSAGGNVYGGGNESKSLSNTTVTLKGDAVIYGDVFGGGNKAEVQGSTTVNIED